MSHNLMSQIFDGGLEEQKEKKNVVPISISSSSHDESSEVESFIGSVDRAVPSQEHPSKR